MRKKKMHIYRKYLKRPMDITLSFLAILLLSPVMLATAILVRLFLGHPILFRQKRPGYKEKLFTLYKFRSMTNERGEKGELLPDELRLHSFGRLLRASSLDELPELFNIIKGDMSIVGPRPLLEHYLPLYDKEQRRRHGVRPGLTGLAQISGRNAISWEEKFRLDLEYIDNISFISDLEIILKTIHKLIRKEGICSGSAATVTPFAGNGADKIIQSNGKRKLLIIGAGGHGKVTADAAACMGAWESIEFLDDNPECSSSLSLPVLGKSAEAFRYIQDYELFVGIGNNRIRERLLSELEEAGASIPVIIHPKAVIGRETVIGKGSVVLAGAVINCSTTIGKGCIINTGATVDHDNILADYVHVSPGVHTGGAVSIGRCTWLGIGSTVNHNITIACNCIVGAGAAVIRDIPEEGTYAGVPAKHLPVHHLETR